MNSASYANNSPNVNKLEACIRQAGVDHGISHCVDGTIHWFQGNYSLYLRAAIKLVLYIFNRLRAGYCEHELDGLINHLKSCRYLPSPDLEVVAVIEILLRNLLQSRFVHLISRPCKSPTTRMNTGFMIDSGPPNPPESVEQAADS